MLALNAKLLGLTALATLAIHAVNANPLPDAPAVGYTGQQAIVGRQDSTPPPSTTTPTNTTTPPKNKKPTETPPKDKNPTITPPGGMPTGTGPTTMDQSGCTMMTLKACMELVGVAGMDDAGDSTKMTKPGKQDPKKINASVQMQNCPATMTMGGSAKPPTKDDPMKLKPEDTKPGDTPPNKRDQGPGIVKPEDVQPEDEKPEKSKKHKSKSKKPKKEDPTKNATADPTGDGLESYMQTMGLCCAHGLNGANTTTGMGTGGMPETAGPTQTGDKNTDTPPNKREVPSREPTPVYSPGPSTNEPDPPVVKRDDPDSMPPSTDTKPDSANPPTKPSTQKPSKEKNTSNDTLPDSTPPPGGCPLTTGTTPPSTIPKPDDTGKPKNDSSGMPPTTTSPTTTGCGGGGSALFILPINNATSVVPPGDINGIGPATKPENGSSGNPPTRRDMNVLHLFGGHTGGMTMLRRGSSLGHAHIKRDDMPGNDKPKDVDPTDQPPKDKSPITMPPKTNGGGMPTGGPLFTVLCYDVGMMSATTPPPN